MSANQITVKVARKRREALDISSYELVPVEAGDLPAFEPGAHIDVHLPNGLIRQYSLCGTPHQENRYRIAVLRDAKSRGGSQAIHDLVNEGDILRISPPRNLFKLFDGKQENLLLAGGIGVTPLLSMAYHLHKKGCQFELHYFARSKSRVAFLDEIRMGELAKNVVFHLDDEPVVDVRSVRALLESAPPDAHVYTCGPMGFLDHVLKSTQDLGWPDHRVHYESFSAAGPVEGDSFEVRIQSTGQSIVVGPKETVVQAVARIGVDIPVSCEQGICGTCLTKVVDGVPAHKDMYLTDAEHAMNNQFTPCCSRSFSPVLVLDL
jgi:vanillate O-demethylase ferredoxin subunit